MKTQALDFGCFWMLLDASGCFWMLLDASGCFWMLLDAWVLNPCHRELMGRILGAVMLVMFAAGLGWLFALNRPHENQVALQNYVMATYGVMKMQVVEDKSLQVLERREQDSAIWDMIRLPDIVVEVRMPVTTAYFVDLQKGFRIEELEGNWILSVPGLEFGPPAADLSAMQFTVRQGQFFQRTDEVRDNLQKTLTPLLEQRATESLERVRPLAEAKLKEFLHLWIASQGKPAAKTMRIFWLDSRAGGTGPSL